MDCEAEAEDDDALRWFYGGAAPEHDLAMADWAAHPDVRVEAGEFLATHDLVKLSPRRAATPLPTP